MAPGTDDQARGVLGPPGPPPAPGAPPHAALRGVLRVRDRPEGHLRGVAARCAGHPSLREQLALHSRQLQLLQRDVGFLAPAAYLVTGGGGAVLRDLAAGRARGHALHPQPAGPVRPVLRGRHRVGSLDASRVRRRPEHQPGLSRDRHALAVPLHRLRAGRGTRAPHAAPARNGPAGQGGAVAAGELGRAGVLWRAGRRRGGGRRHAVGADHLHVRVSLLGRVLPHRVVGGKRDPRRGRSTAQHRPAAAVVVTDPLCGPHFVRALHLALAHLHMARRRPDGPLRVRALRRARRASPLPCRSSPSTSSSARSGWARSSASGGPGWSCPPVSVPYWWP